MSLELGGVTLRYGRRVIVDGVTLKLEGGQLIALVGPNGAGKSSLLKAIVGLVAVEGTIHWRGRALKSARQRAQTLAYLPQHAEAHWPIRVRDLVALGRLPHRRFGAPPSAADHEVLERVMREAEISELADRSIHPLSGGEQARVHLARALAVAAPVLLVDEPVASLDPYHQLQIMAVLEAYASAGGLVIAVLHDLTLAARYCERMVLIDAGRIVEHGPPQAVLRDELLRKHYHIEAYLAEHGGQAVIVPWRRLD